MSKFVASSTAQPARALRPSRCVWSSGNTSVDTSQQVATVVSTPMTKVTVSLEKDSLAAKIAALSLEIADHKECRSNAAYPRTWRCVVVLGAPAWGVFE